MASKLLTAPEREGKTFNIAIRILGAAALCQILLAVWSVLIRFDGTEINPANTLNLVRFPVTALESPPAPEEPSPLSEVYAPGPPPGESTPLAAAAGNAPQPGGEQDSTPPDKAAVLLAQQGQPSPPLSTFSAARPPLPNHLAHRISLPEVDELVSQALRMREQGDTQGALEALRQADGKLPSHPKILAELATTLQQMGLDSKAAEYWERVHQMHPEGAGAYWDLADMALKGQILDEASNLDTYLRITRHTARAMPASDGAEQVILRIHIEAAPQKAVSGEDMYLNVLFYDAVNGSTFAPTVADTKPIYVTQPYDWKDDSEEIIEVEYFLPKLGAEQVATLGQRRFFGYVVELYYKDLLQDIVASPRKLARLGSSASRAARPIRQSLPQPP